MWMYLLDCKGHAPGVLSDRSVRFLDDRAVIDHDLQGHPPRAVERGVAAPRHALLGLGVAEQAGDEYLGHGLERPHAAVGIRNLHVSAFVGDRVVPKELLDDVQGLQEVVARLAELEAELVEFVALIAAAEPENQPAPTQLVEHRDVLEHA